MNKKLFVLCTVIVVLLFATSKPPAVAADEATPPVIGFTQTPTSTPTATQTPTRAATPTSSPTVTQTPTNTPTPTSTTTPTTTPTPTQTPTSRPTQTPLPTWTPSPTASPVPTATPRVGPDEGEPNDSISQARPLVPEQVGRYEVGAEDPQDMFALLTKQWTRYRCETDTTSVDTEMSIQDAAGNHLYYNDDVMPGEIASAVEWTASAEMTVYVVIAARGGTYGAYSIRCLAFAPPTETPTPPPTSTPRPVSVVAPSNPTPLPMPTPTIMATVALSVTGSVTATSSMTPTATPDTRIPLVVRSLGRVTQPTVEQTEVSLLIYYDANNDRKPSPQEGVPNVSVLVVNGNGLPLQQAFTSSNGEVRLRVGDDAQRLVVPFVSGWSEAIRHGALGIGASNSFQIGLQAVEIPVFIPVQTIFSTPETN